MSTSYNTLLNNIIAKLVYNYIYIKFIYIIPDFNLMLSNSDSIHKI